jgi:hypothetical protein
MSAVELALETENRVRSRLSGQSLRTAGRAFAFRKRLWRRVSPQEIGWMS